MRWPSETVSLPGQVQRRICTLAEQACRSAPPTPMLMLWCLASNDVIDSASTLRFAGVKAQKAAAVLSSEVPPPTYSSTHFSITSQRHLLADRPPLASLPMAIAFAFPQPLQMPAPMPVVVGGSSHNQLGQLATRAVREQRAPAPVIARVVRAP